LLKRWNSQSGLFCIQIEKDPEWQPPSGVNSDRLTSVRG